MNQHRWQPVEDPAWPAAVGTRRLHWHCTRCQTNTCQIVVLDALDVSPPTPLQMHTDGHTWQLVTAGLWRCRFCECAVRVADRGQTPPPYDPTFCWDPAAPGGG